MDPKSRRALWQFAILLIAIALILAGFWRRQRHHEPRLMTLSQALWVTDRDGPHLYPPGSTQAQAVLSGLPTQGVSVTEAKYDESVLYRQGLTDADKPSEPLLIVGFVPFTHARIIDGTGGPPLEDATLISVGGRIVVVAAHAVIPPGTRQVDLTGKTIMPALISAHSHLGLVQGAAGPSPEFYTRENVARQVAQYEAYGVTAVMSLGVNRDELYRWRAESLPGADIFTADRGLGVPGGQPPFAVPDTQMYRPADPQAARADVNEMAARHPDLIKLWVDDNFGQLPKMQPDVYQAIIAEAHAGIDQAHQRGLRVAAHMFYLADAKALVDAGVDILAHSVRDLPVDDELIEKMKARHVVYIPTLTLDESQYIYAEHPAWMDAPFFTSAVSPELLSKWLSPDYAEKTRANPTTPKNRAAHEMAMKNLKTLYDAGAYIAMGTDTGAFPTRIAGFDEHRELQLMVEAGMRPMDAITAATAHSAEAIGDKKNRGTLDVGKRADFIVLNANPLDDIKNTERISAVWHGGEEKSHP